MRRVQRGFAVVTPLPSLGWSPRIIRHVDAEYGAFRLNGRRWLALATAGWRKVSLERPRSPCWKDQSRQLATSHEFKSFIDNPAYYAGGKTRGRWRAPGVGGVLSRSRLETPSVLVVWRPESTLCSLR